MQQLGKGLLLLRVSLLLLPFARHSSGTPSEKIRGLGGPLPSTRGVPMAAAAVIAAAEAVNAAPSGRFVAAIVGIFVVVVSDAGVGLGLNPDLRLSCNAALLYGEH